MNMFRSLRTKIMLGFVAVLSIAIVCFTTTLFIAREFRRVDTERVAAVRQLREAVTAGDLVKAAEAKLSDYLRSGSVASAHEMLERVSAVAQVGGISGSGTDWEALKRLAAATVETIDAAAEANKNLADLTGTLGNPGAALGWNAGDPALVSETSHLQFSLGQYALAANRFAATGDVRLLEAVKAESVRIGASADAIAGFPGAGDGTKKRIQALRRLAGSTDAAVRNLKAALDKRQETSNQLIAQIQKIASDAAKVQTSANGHFDAAAKEAEASSDRLFEALVASTLVVACAGIGLAILLGGSIARPILALKEAIARIASGDLGSAIPGMERLDEIGQMAKSVQIFRDNGVRLRETETAAEELRRAAEAERARNDALTARSAAQQKHVVEVIASGLERLANGELIYRIQDSFPAEYLKLRDDFNGAMQKLQEAMTLVSVNTSTIHNGTHEISSASDDLSRRTGQQAASLEELTATLNQIAMTVRKTAEGAKNAREIVTGTKTGAEQSQSIVDDAVNAMGGIEKSAGQISQIVGLIDEIAFQTNLLALNAGVEAARAGDAGRGFAVVASEVRALAQRSAEASKEIKALIDASSRQVGQGVDLVRRTGVALRTIITQVGEINRIVTEIAQSAAAQAGSLDEVKAVFSQMDQVTQQNAAMAEESTAASRALTRDTEELAVLIGRFEVGQAVAPGAGARAKSAVRH